MSAHGTTSAPGPTSYGYQIAAAATEFVRSPTSSARTQVSNPCSWKTIPQVSPETPAPTMPIRRFIVVLESKASLKERRFETAVFVGRRFVNRRSLICAGPVAVSYNVGLVAL